MATEASQNHDLAILSLWRKMHTLSLATSDSVTDLAEKLYLVNEELRHLKPNDPLDAWYINGLFQLNFDRSYRIVIDDILRDGHAMTETPY